MRLILASASPRRSELLKAAGLAFDVRPADVDESIRPGESADAYVRRLAAEKARAAGAAVPGSAVLGADTIVVSGGEILGKPRDEQDATRMLRLLSGRTHEVMTGVCLYWTDVRLSPPPPLRRPGKPDVTSDDPVRLKPDPTGAGRSNAGSDVRVAVTTVEFARLTDADMAWYVGTGEPIGKAGGYAVQGLASRFVTRIDGSYSNVVGLPVALVYEMCSDAGILLS